MNRIIFLLAITCINCAFAQISEEDRKIEFPDVPGYKTLKVDLHQHTVFSDGNVWPSIRVEESWKDGLDAIAMTDHLEYQPHTADIPHPDHNRSYEIASMTAENGPADLLVIRGAEITRSMPPGHSNAIFLQDVNKLLQDDPLPVFREAKSQGAFIFWNHPAWTAQRPDGVATLTDLHRQLIEEDLLHGIEVVNELTYSEEALQIALDHDLVILGTSDIHGLIDWEYDVAYGGHRPVTLVFATENSLDAIQDALENSRTVVWYNNILIGRPAQLIPLVNACLSIEKAEYQGNSTVATVSIRNNSDVEFILENLTDYTFQTDTDMISIKPHGVTDIEVRTTDKFDEFELNFRVWNALTAPKTHPEMTLEVEMK